MRHGGVDAAAAGDGAAPLAVAAGAATPDCATPAATPAQLLAGVLSSWTVAGVSDERTPLRQAFRRWGQACGIRGDCGSVCVVELLPQYGKLLSHLDDWHRSKRLAAATLYVELCAVCRFLKQHQQALQSSSAEYVAMLNSMDAARSRYHQLSTQMFIGSSKHTAAASPAAAAAASAAGIHTNTAAVGAVAGPAGGVTDAQLHLQLRAGALSWEAEAAWPSAGAAGRAAAGQECGRPQGWMGLSGQQQQQHINQSINQSMLHL